MRPIKSYINKFDYKNIEKNIEKNVLKYFNRPNKPEIVCVDEDDLIQLTAVIGKPMTKIIVNNKILKNILMRLIDEGVELCFLEMSVYPKEILIREH